ncbi:MAG: hypothetical protein U1F77_18045 [Kiritimatiellia bacterium]
MIALDTQTGGPFTGFLARTILEADPSCARHVAEAAARAASDYLGEMGFGSSAPSAFMGVVLARCLGRIGMSSAARAVLRETENHPGRRRWWSGLADGPAFDPAIWHAMDRRILCPAPWLSGPGERTLWRLDLQRLRAEGVDWAELAWLPSLRRLVEGLCACEESTDGSFCLAVTGGTGGADAAYCARVLAREAARRRWPRPPSVWSVAAFTPGRARSSRR